MEIKWADVEVFCTVLVLFEGFRWFCGFLVDDP